MKYYAATIKLIVRADSELDANTRTTRLMNAAMRVGKEEDTTFPMILDWGYLANDKGREFFREVFTNLRMEGTPEDFIKSREHWQSVWGKADHEITDEDMVRDEHEATFDEL